MAQAGVLGSRGAVPVLRVVNVCELVNPESVVCVPALMTSCLCQPQRRRGHCRLCLGVMWVLCVGAGDRSALSVAVCLTGHLSVLCVCVCVSGKHAHLRYWLNLQTEKWQLHPLAWAGTRGPQAAGLGSSGRAGRFWSGAAEGGNLSWHP